MNDNQKHILVMLFNAWTDNEKRMLPRYCEDNIKRMVKDIEKEFGFDIALHIEERQAKLFRILFKATEDTKK